MMKRILINIFLSFVAQNLYINSICKTNLLYRFEVFKYQKDHKKIKRATMEL